MYISQNTSCFLLLFFLHYGFTRGFNAVLCIQAHEFTMMIIVMVYYTYWIGCIFLYDMSYFERLEMTELILLVKNGFFYFYFFEQRYNC